MKDKIWQGNKKKHLSKNPIVSFLDKKLKKDIIKIIKNLKIKTILDVGCGEGFITSEIARAFPKIQITAMDPEQSYIDYAKRFNSLPNVVFIKSDLNSIKIKADLVISTEVLEHLQNPEDALFRLIKLSKEYLIFSVPNEPFFRIGNFLSLKYVSRFGNTPGHINNWTKRKLERFVSKSNLNFKIKRSTFWNIVVIKTN